MTDKQLAEKEAEKYAEETNSAYTNDYYGFLAGINSKSSELKVVEGKIEILKYLKLVLYNGYYSYKIEELETKREQLINEIEKV
jgi:hypothetical protein